MLCIAYSSMNTNLKSTLLPKYRSSAWFNYIPGAPNFVMRELTGSMGELTGSMGVSTASMGVLTGSIL